LSWLPRLDIDGEESLPPRELALSSEAAD
jgi:hypothetical protein